MKIKVHAKPTGIPEGRIAVSPMSQGTRHLYDALIALRLMSVTHGVGKGNRKWYSLTPLGHDLAETMFKEDQP